MNNRCLILKLMPDKKLSTSWKRARLVQNDFFHREKVKILILSLHTVIIDILNSIQQLDELDQAYKEQKTELSSMMEKLDELTKQR